MLLRWSTRFGTWSLDFTTNGWHLHGKSVGHSAILLGIVGCPGGDITFPVEHSNHPTYLVSFCSKFAILLLLLTPIKVEKNHTKLEATTMWIYSVLVFINIALSLHTAITWRYSMHMLIRLWARDWMPGSWNFGMIHLPMFCKSQHLYY